jgi:A/G-specific adenine glycosylase
MEGCEARKLGIQEQLPRKGEKAARPLKRGAAFVVRDTSGAVLLVKRPEKGLLGGMLQPPLGPWTEDFPSIAEAMKQAPFKAGWKKRVGVVRHGFTHFELEIEVYVAEVEARPPFSSHVYGGRAVEDGEGGKRRKAPLRRAAHASSPVNGGGKHSGVFWVEELRLKDAALPTVMRKIVTHGL